MPAQEKAVYVSENVCECVYVNECKIMWMTVCAFIWISNCEHLYYEKFLTVTMWSGMNEKIYWE